MMSKENLQLNFKELIKEPSTRKDVCDLFVYEPRNVEEAQLGTLFMLGKIGNVPKNKYRNLDFLLNLLISAIKREFYSDSIRQPIEALESSLNKANLYLADFTEKGNTEWIGNLDFICGIFSQNALHIAQVGGPIIKLFRETTISHIDRKFPTQKKYYPPKTFGNIASGVILNGDKIILSTKNISNIISLPKLKELSKKDCNQIVEGLKKLIKNETNKDSMICLVLETSPAPRPVLEQIERQPVLNKNRKIAPFYQGNKPAFFIAAALLILILILPFSVVQKINYYIKLGRFNKLSTEIQEIQRKADVALIYQDKNRARILIQKNQALIIELSNYFEDSPKAITLQNKHQNQQDSISNVQRIGQLNEILNFSTSGFIVNPAGISKIDNALYFYEFDSGILYKFNLSGEKDLTLVFISAKDELRKMVSLENGKIVLFGQSGKMYLYNSNTNDHKSYDSIIPVENIKDIRSFSSSFYILDTKSGITKYSNELKESKWLSGQLENAQSMAIDGSIYILNSNGIINRYFQSKKAEETHLNLERPLGGNNKIFIKSDFKNFYISDPTNKRIIVLNKQGKVINQYVHNEFSNLQDFWITKNEKEIYLLCGKKVFKLEL